MKWKDPPPRTANTQGEGVWMEEAAELKANPGKWALLAAFGGAENNHSARAMAVNIKSGRYTAFRPHGHFEATSATTTDRSATEVYARYVGPPPEEKKEA